MQYGRTNPRLKQVQHPDGHTVILAYDFEHRFPDWMPFRLHLRLESLLILLSPLFMGAKGARVLSSFYHIAGGLICGYTLPEIAGFLRGRIRA